MTIVFAPQFLRAETTPPPKLVGSSKSSGKSASGISINSRSDGGGLWTFQRSGIPVRTADDLRFWNAMQELLDEGATPVVVPICESRTAPWPIVDGKRLTHYDPLPFSDGTLFSDGTGFEAFVIDIALADDAALRATTINLTLNYGSPLRGGELFSFDYGAELGPRMHRAISVDTDDDVNFTVQIRPPLRDDLVAGSEANFDQPRCVMQLDTMDIPLETGRFAKASISFIESFLPLS